MEVGNYIEEKGLGFILRKPFLVNEDPLSAADNLVCFEDKDRTKFASIQQPTSPEHVLAQHQFL